MSYTRRDILKYGALATGLGTTSATLANSRVTNELRRRLQYLTMPQGTPPDLLAHPSPPVDPWKPLTQSQLVPPIVPPLIKMPQISKVKTEDAWWQSFVILFEDAANALRTKGFIIPEESNPWPVRNDQTKIINDGNKLRCLIDIGSPPLPEAHQRFFEFAPLAFYVNREVEFDWEFHKQFGNGTASWGYHAIYRGEDNEFYGTRPCSPGPTIHARYGEPVLLRRMNDLPELGPQDAHARIRFARGSTASHLHNGHTASESDGYPNDWIDSGEYWDHHYGNFPQGHDEREKLCTLWYHDHRMDFTAANVYAGLDGFYFLFDEKTPEDEEDPVSGDLNDESKGWRLPAWQEKKAGGRTERVSYDIPLVFHDLAFAQEIEYTGEDGKKYRRPRPVSRDQSTRYTFESPQDWAKPTDEEPTRGVVVAGGERKAIKHVGFREALKHSEAGVARSYSETASYEPSPQLLFDGFNTDGIIGDRWTVNRRIQPSFNVECRKYRVRLLNGGPSRFYEIFLYAVPKGEKQYVENDMLVVTGDGNFQPNPVIARCVYLAVAQRVDLIIDFRDFEPGTSVYLVNELEQSNGRGPTERRILRKHYASDQDFFDANGFIRFNLDEEAVEDPSRFPLVFREFPPIDFTEVKRERLWEFDYDGGLWTINGNIYDPNRVDAGIEQDSAEIWTFRNGGTLWHHPIHSHFCEFVVLERDGQPFSQGSIQQSVFAGVAEDSPGAEVVANTEMRRGNEVRTEEQEEFEKSARISAQLNPATAIQESVGATILSGFSTQRNIESAIDRFFDRDRERNGSDTSERSFNPEEDAGNSIEEQQETFDLHWAKLVDDATDRLEERNRANTLDEGQGRDKLQEDAATLKNQIDIAIEETPELLSEVFLLVLDQNPRIDEVRFRRIPHYRLLGAVLGLLGLRQPILPDPGRFMGGARRDVAVLQPNTEVTVFMRWKDFLGSHVMHCHNVVHEDHAMMVRWDIMQSGKGFDVPQYANTVAQFGAELEPERRDHYEGHPEGVRHQPDDSRSPIIDK